MNNINSTLSAAFDDILKDIRLPHAHYKDICASRDEILALDEKIREAKNVLRYKLEKLYAALGTEIRKNCPKLSVMLNHNGCVISFKSKSIVCKAIPVENRWDFGSDFGKVFTSRNPQFSALDCDLTELANAINSHFSYQYRSLE